MPSGITGAKLPIPFVCKTAKMVNNILFIPASVMPAVIGVNYIFINLRTGRLFH